MAAARRTPGITARLMALALVPAVGLTAVSLENFLGTRRDVEQAEAVERIAGSLSATTRLRYAVLGERVDSEVLVRTRALGVDLDIAERFLGYDVRERLATMRARTDELLEERPDVGTATALAVFRDLVDREVATPDDVLSGMGPLQAVLEQSSEEDLQALRTAVASTEAAVGAVSAALDDLNSATVVLDQAQQVNLDLASALVDTGQGPEAKEEARLRAVSANAVLRKALGGLPQLGDAPADQAVAFLRSEDAYTEAMAYLSSGVAIASVPVDEVGTVFTASLARLDAAYTIVDGATGRLRTSAAALQAAERQQLRTAGALGAGAVAFSLLASYLLALSISRPIRRLTDHVGAVRDGNLRTSAPASGEPREVRTLRNAFDELVGNLQVVQHQAEALARGRVDEIAGAPIVPGPLGESLQASVDLLTRTLSEQQRLQEQLTRQATHDALTGLWNRAASIAALEEGLTRARKRGSLIAAIFLDLDDFKHANDTLGHAAGDRVLFIAAERLQNAVRPADRVGRLGGDEFVIVTGDLATPDEAVAIARRALDVLQEPIEVEGSKLNLGASAGVALAPAGAVGALALLQEADVAVYRAKTAGKGTVEVFDEGLRAELQQRASLEAALRAGLERNELHLVYQPIVDARTLELTGVEVLARWDRPGYGPVPPSEFIAVAEGSALIVEVERWVLRRACEEVAAWQQDPVLGRVRVAVNLSARHLVLAGVVDEVLGAAAATDLPLDRLTVEVTETSVLTDVSAVNQHLSQLRRSGVRVAVDDFGTGYTSLAHLRGLPIDVLKIDQSLVAEVHQSKGEVVVGLLVGMGHALGLEVTAEGVEHHDQAARLRRLEVDRFQGFGIARPMGADALRTWAARRTVTDGAIGPVTAPAS